MTDRINEAFANAHMDVTVEGITETLKDLSTTSQKYIGRAVQLTEERLNNMPVTKIDQLDEPRERAHVLMEQTDLIVKELESFLDPTPGVNLEKFLPISRGNTAPTSRYHHIASTLRTASLAYGADTPFGRVLGQVADAQEDIGSEHVSISARSQDTVTKPMKAVGKDLALLSANERELGMLRLDLDAAKAKARKATDNDRVLAAEAQIRQAQYDFDRQYDRVEQQLNDLAEIPAEQTKLLHVLVAEQLEFHRKSAAILQALAKTLPTAVEVQSSLRDSMKGQSTGKAAFKTKAPLICDDDVQEDGQF
eukprot:Ihof_evm2s342 gene=Ihof_evmTU2s342